METMNRRSFVQTAGAAAGLAVVACGASSALADEASVDLAHADPAALTWDLEADVVVVGSGSTGYCAAIEAAEAGSSVIVLEKQVVPGGDSQACGGVILGAGWRDQERLTGYAGDTPERFAAQQLRYCQGLGNAEIIEQTCLRSGEAIDWMADMGRVFDSADIIPPIWCLGDTEEDIVPRAAWYAPEINDPEYRPGAGNGHYKTLQAKVDELGDTIQVLCDHRAIHLVRGSDGQVLGVQVVVEDNEDEPILVKARKGVVLACASVDSNAEMAKDLGLMQQVWGLSFREQGIQNPSCRDVPTNTGDGVRMIREIGADLMLGQACCMNDFHYFGGIGESYSAYGHDSNAYHTWKNEGGILVNQRGKRFVQEDAEWGWVISQVADECYRCGWKVEEPVGVAVYALTDADHLWQWQNQGADPSQEGSLAVSADTLEELAEKIGVSAEALVKTVEDWNSYCETGVDPDFDRRTDYGTIATPPFYADPIRPGAMGTFAGAKVNLNAEVLDLAGNPIPRLYAAGAMAGGNYMGNFYPGCGYSIMCTVVWGREAGQQAAALEPWA